MAQTNLAGRPLALVHCEKCNRQVDSFTVDKPAFSFQGDDGYQEYVYTGETIVTVECHGETWKMSNQRGRLTA
jgi:hypothetical protein